MSAKPRGSTTDRREARAEPKAAAAIARGARLQTPPTRHSVIQRIARVAPVFRARPIATRATLSGPIGGAEYGDGTSPVGRRRRRTWSGRVAGGVLARYRSSSSQSRWRVCRTAEGHVVPEEGVCRNRWRGLSSGGGSVVTGGGSVDRRRVGHCRVRGGVLSSGGGVCCGATGSTGAGGGSCGPDVSAEWGLAVEWRVARPAAADRPWPFRRTRTRRRRPPPGPEFPSGPGALGAVRYEAAGCSERRPISPQPLSPHDGLFLPDGSIAPHARDHHCKRRAPRRAAGRHGVELGEEGRG